MMFYYGMLDANKELGYAPVVDLKIMFEMNEWILGANQFKVSMNGNKIVSLLEKKDKDLANVIDSFSKALNINYANEIQQQIKKLRDFDTSQIQNPEKLIVDKVINEFIDHFSDIEKQSIFQYELAKWYYQKYNFGNSFVVLAEAIITLLCELKGYDPFEQYSREKSKDYLKSIKRQKKHELFPLYDIYIQIKDIRNNISHNLQERENMHLDDIKRLPEYFKILKVYFK